MELNSCWANFCAVKIAAAVMHVMCVHCRLHKVEMWLSSGRNKGHGDSSSHLSPSALQKGSSLIPARAKAPL